MIGKDILSASPIGFGNPLAGTDRAGIPSVSMVLINENGVTTQGTKVCGELRIKGLVNGTCTGDEWVGDVESKDSAGT